MALPPEADKNEGEPLFSSRPLPFRSLLEKIGSALLPVKY
jgi:hypothetical protein